MRPRILLLGLAGIIVALVVLSLAESLLVDLLWFSTLGYRQVFIITLGAQVAIFAIVWAVAFLAIWISGMIALRLNRERGPPCSGPVPLAAVAATSEPTVTAQIAARPKKTLTGVHS